MHPLNTIIIVLIFATTIFPQQSIIKNYTAVDGLPVSTIYDCVQASNGNMWFASESGLIEYDGTEWIVHDSLDSQALNFARGFLEVDSAQTLWVIPRYTSDPMSYFKNGNWSFTNKISDTMFTSIAYDIVSSKKEVNSQIVIGVNSPSIYLSVNGGNHFEKISLPNIEYINDVKFFSNQLLIATDEGLFYFDYIKRKLGLNLLPKNEPIYCIDKRSDPSQIYLLSDKWVGALENGKIKKLISGFDLQIYSGHINSPFLSKTPNGDFLFGTKYQLMRYSPYTNFIERLDKADDSSTLGATSVFIDYEKNTWITTYRGIKKIKYSPFLSWISTEQLLENEVTALSKFPYGPLIIGHNSGITLYNKAQNYSKFISFDNTEGDEFSRILYMQYDIVNDLVWFNSQQQGIGTFDRSGNLEWVISTKNKKRSSISSFYLDKNNVCYYSMPGVFNKLTKDNYSETLFDFNQREFFVRGISEYDDNLIIASKYGLYIYNTLRKEIINYTHPERNKNNVYCVHKIDTNNWLIGSHGGLLVFDGKELKEFPDLKITVPIFFIERENDHIWFGLMGGALRWNPKTGEQKRFTTKDGFAGVETNRDAFLFDNNKVYIGTENGLSIFIPDAYHAEYYKIKPKINFIGISDLDGNISNITEDIEFSYTNNDLIIMYNSPSFIDETAMTYTVLLENIDEETTEIYNTNETSFYLRNLAPGEYKVGVSSINPNGVSSDTVYSNTIFIGSPFYTQSWFLTLLVLLSIAVSYSIYNYIVRSRYSNLLEEKVKIRTSQLQESEKNIRILTQRIFTAQEEQSEKIARDLHDHIAQDMAVLKLEVDKLIESNKSEHENYSWISDKISELTIYLRDLAYFLHANSIKQTGFVNSIHALCNDFNNHMKIDVEFFTNIEESFKISEESGNNIYRFIQEALWNVRKHSDANSALVILVKQDDFLIIRIEDDGKGFEVEEVLHSSNNRRMGLKSMEERILFLQGKFSIKSVIKDGTKIKAVIPLSAINYSTSEANVDQASTL